MNGSSDRGLEGFDERRACARASQSEPEQARARMQLEQAPSLERAEAFGEPMLDPSVKRRGLFGVYLRERARRRQVIRRVFREVVLELGFTPDDDRLVTEQLRRVGIAQAERDPSHAGEPLAEPSGEGGESIA